MTELDEFKEYCNDPLKGWICPFHKIIEEADYFAGNSGTSYCNHFNASLRNVFCQYRQDSCSPVTYRCVECIKLEKESVQKYLELISDRPMSLEARVSILEETVKKLRHETKR